MIVPIIMLEMCVKPWLNAKATPVEPMQLVPYLITRRSVLVPLDPQEIPLSLVTTIHPQHVFPLVDITTPSMGLNMITQEILLTMSPDPVVETISM